LQGGGGCTITSASPSKRSVGDETASPQKAKIEGGIARTRVAKAESRTALGPGPSLSSRGRCMSGSPSRRFHPRFFFPFPPRVLSRWSVASCSTGLVAQCGSLPSPGPSFPNWAQLPDSLVLARVSGLGCDRAGRNAARINGLSAFDLGLGLPACDDHASGARVPDGLASRGLAGAYALPPLPWALSHLHRPASPATKSTHSHSPKPSRLDLYALVNVMHMCSCMFEGFLAVRQCCHPSLFMAEFLVNAALEREVVAAAALSVATLSNGKKNQS